MHIIRTVLISIVFTLLLAKYFNEEIPTGISQPTLVKFLAMPMKICFELQTFGHTLGLNGPAMMRASMNGLAGLVNMVMPVRCTHTDMRIEHVRVRMYKPPGTRKTDLLRGVVFFHGGGWTTGSIETHTSIADRLAHDLHAVVWLVDYRKAPEHVFPAAFNDCVLAAKYLLLNAKTYNADPSRMAVMGDSAGGNLAAAVALKLRDDEFRPSLKLQVLIYPGLQAVSATTPSRQYNRHAAMLKTHWTVQCMANYVFGHWDYLDLIEANNVTSPAKKAQLADTYMNLDLLPNDIIKQKYEPQTLNSGNETFWEEHKTIFENPYLSPLLADDLTGLPPVYISSCKYDPIRDDSYFYEARLKAAKVPVEHIRLNACLHTWLNGHDLIDSFDLYFRDMVSSIKDDL